MPSNKDVTNGCMTDNILTQTWTVSQVAMTVLNIDHSSGLLWQETLSDQIH